MTIDIPKGFYCYTMLSEDNNKYKVKPCPFFKRTAYGTVVCEHLNIESIDPTSSGKQNRIAAIEYFGSVEALDKATEDGGILWDAVKECDINYGGEDDDY